MEMTTIKTIAVFTIIFGCFAVLYPKIFHPMLTQVFAIGQRSEGQDSSSNRIPPHLRKPGEGKIVQQDEDISRYMARAGPHPGMRAAAEMKKQASTQAGGSGKGMMSVVLPMYAIGIVIYLIYTMIKVFGGNKAADDKGDFLKSHFSDIQYDSNRKKFTKSPQEPVQEVDEETDISNRFKKGRRDLERLLLKADKNNINAYEMHELRSRLMETEAQMARILGALEVVEDQVSSVSGKTEIPEETDEEWVDDNQTAPQQDEAQAEVTTVQDRSPSDSSPDMDCYEIIRGKSETTTPDVSSAPSPTVEDVGPEFESVPGAAGPTQTEDSTHNATQQHAKCKNDQAVDESTDIVIGNRDSADDEKHPDLRKRAVIQAKGEE